MENNSASRIQTLSRHLTGGIEHPGVLDDADEVTKQVYTKWHQSIKAAFENEEEKAMDLLSLLFSEDVSFKAPTYWKTRKSKKFAIFALVGVSKVFKDFKYTREFIGVRW